MVSNVFLKKKENPFFLYFVLFRVSLILPDALQRQDVQEITFDKFHLRALENGFAAGVFKIIRNIALPNYYLIWITKRSA
ncbi:hypothetical protein EFB08_05640 [Rufibacter latericius]|uniref:Uncharacterized protein n=1 Tax=Rufibacter latericius TaxID=2487040 RepID=A0A3M9N016_9BACT|nr:hypothetical protein EFB08_05640 [Rufibacter latericius]